ncbi:MAG: sulfite exporter TauE/SafE family protein [Candidatus Omnitrophica bacterium]|nr:sulfite exporter TauE/SafE family protein [Candidatus Omnitrophota bacterium]MCF7891813.1 sulfite exporter TauE/SafE family protein [Candidatus Omnitrophota bacterium]MCF7895961.1 sulfite exporter TauE/SafE family protein [Candidatus Omnitrophota bacterium]MCF7897798.1 sulfite exporter TauE/SafE family protein [Candidatus Omnitrophota bacterium]MCF7909176.1 sulfite exporter TauE/SafE family protein [Candidatus Omnitrophota bacterium]
MAHNLYYLFISGIVLGSGPCLAFCAPLLASYSAVFKKGFQKSLISYLIFSTSKIISYIILALIWTKVVNLFSDYLLKRYSSLIYNLLAIFIILIGITTLFYKKDNPNWFCRRLHKGNIRNVGIIGFLVGFAPCLPLIGILNYIAIISSNLIDAGAFALAFGLGTAISPLILIIAFSAKLSQFFSKSKKGEKIIRIICGLILISLGLLIILQTPLR